MLDPSPNSSLPLEAADPPEMPVGPPAPARPTSASRLQRRLSPAPRHQEQVSNFFSFLLLNQSPASATEPDSTLVLDGDKEDRAIVDPSRVLTDSDNDSTQRISLSERVVHENKGDFPPTTYSSR